MTTYYFEEIQSTQIFMNILYDMNSFCISMTDDVRTPNHRPHSTAERRYMRV